MDSRQQRIWDILRAMERIKVPQARGAVAVGAILIDTLDLPLMVAVDGDGRLRYCAIEDGTMPILLVTVVGVYFGPSEIIAGHHEPIHVSKVADLTTASLGKYVWALAREAEFGKVPQDDLRPLLEQLSNLEDRVLVARPIPHRLSIVWRPFELDRLN